MNLDPVNHSTKIAEKQNSGPEGRKATIENYKKAQKVGFDIICLTGNPAGVAPVENIFALSETIRGKLIAISHAARSVRR